MNSETAKVVTLSGECWEAEFRRKERAQGRDGVWYLFHLKDLTKNRNERLVSLYRFGPKEFYAEDYDGRVETVRLNTLRHAFDSGLLSFDAPYDEHTYKELPLEASDFAPQSPVSDQAIKQFIMNMAYWLGFRYSPNPGTYLIQFDAPADLAYLGVSSEDVKRYVWLLEEQGFLDNTLEAMGRPTAKLVGLYESQQSISLPNEKVFPKGTQYEAFKEITGILRSATREIFIADNYLDESVLDMLAALPMRPVLKLLTYTRPADFKVAVKRFQSQYQRPIEVRLHQKEVHDRAIVIDDTHFYALGASIKDIGEKLALLTGWKTRRTSQSSATSFRQFGIRRSRCCDALMSMTGSSGCVGIRRCSWERAKSMLAPCMAFDTGWKLPQDFIAVQQQMTISSKEGHR